MRTTKVRFDDFEFEIFDYCTKKMAFRMSELMEEIAEMKETDRLKKEQQDREFGKKDVEIKKKIIKTTPVKKDAKNKDEKKKKAIEQLEEIKEEMTMQKSKYTTLMTNEMVKNAIYKIFKVKKIKKITGDNQAVTTEEIIEEVPKEEWDEILDIMEAENFTKLSNKCSAVINKKMKNKKKS